jgi:putative DNA primase/helicase
MAAETLNNVVDLPTNPPSSSSSPAPTEGKRKRKSTLAPDVVSHVAHLERNFALVYNSDTAFDSAERVQIRISYMRHAFGKAVRLWLESPARKTIRQDQIVFDPTQPNRPWNLYPGMPTTPKAGDCSKILELLDYLVAGDEALRTWVLRWIAYPLQHPGAKMATAIVMRGPQGGGKNMFFEMVRDIYGHLGTLITQSELESQYNDWCSAKLFVIGNEVLSRREKWQLGGKLKNLVTEPQIPIQAKYMPGRVEANCANLVFLSNDLLPVPLDRDDRRYQVIDAPNPHPDGAAFYRAVAEQIASGGRDAFYAYALELDLGDFGPHTKPIRTEAFYESLDVSLDASGLFIGRWKAKDLAAMQSGDACVHVGAAAIDDLYLIYRRWCEQHGERHADTQTRFARNLSASGYHKRRMRLRLGGRERQETVYWHDDHIPETCADLDAWLAAECGYANGCAYPVGGSK